MTARYDIRTITAPALTALYRELDLVYRELERLRAGIDLHRPAYDPIRGFICHACSPLALGASSAEHRPERLRHIPWPCQTAQATGIAAPLGAAA